MNAPDFSKCMFSAPIAILEPFAAFTAAWISVNGTQRTISHHLVLERSGFISSIRAFASAGVLFIFQLPAIMVLRYLRFMLVLPLSNIRTDFSVLNLYVFIRSAQQNALRYKAFLMDLLVLQACDARQLQTLEELQRSAAAGGDVESSCQQSPASQQQLRSRRRR